MGLTLKRTPKWERPKKGPQNGSDPKRNLKIGLALKGTQNGSDPKKDPKMGTQKWDWP